MKQENINLCFKYLRTNFMKEGGIEWNNSRAFCIDLFEVNNHYYDLMQSLLMKFSEVDSDGRVGDPIQAAAIDALEPPALDLGACLHCGELLSEEQRRPEAAISKATKSKPKERASGRKITEEVYDAICLNDLNRFDAMAHGEMVKFVAELLPDDNTRQSISGALGSMFKNKDKFPLMHMEHKDCPEGIKDAAGNIIQRRFYSRVFDSAK